MLSNIAALLSPHDSHLAGGSTDEGEAGQGHDGVDHHLAGAHWVVEVLLHWGGEVQGTGEDGDDLGTAGLELSDHTGVVTLVAGHQVGLLEDQSDGGGVLVEDDVGTGVVPRVGKEGGQTMVGMELRECVCSVVYNLQMWDKAPTCQVVLHRGGPGQREVTTETHHQTAT